MLLGSAASVAQRRQNGRGPRLGASLHGDATCRRGRCLAARAPLAFVQAVSQLGPTRRQHVHLFQRAVRYKKVPKFLPAHRAIRRVRARAACRGQPSRQHVGTSRWASTSPTRTSTRPTGRHVLTRMQSMSTSYRRACRVRASSKDFRRCPSFAGSTHVEVAALQAMRANVYLPGETVARPTSASRGGLPLWCGVVDVVVPRSWSRAACHTGSRGGRHSRRSSSARPLPLHAPSFTRAARVARCDVCHPSCTAHACWRAVVLRAHFNSFRSPFLAAAAHEIVGPSGVQAEASTLRG